MTTRVRFLGLGALILSTGIACGSAPAGPAPAGASQPAAQPTAAATATTAPQAPSFVDIVGAGRQASYKVVYRISGTSQGTSLAGEQTVYFKPPKRRMDTKMGGEDTSMFMLEDGTYMCMAQGGTRTCLKMPQGQSLPPGQAPAGQAQEQVHANPGQYDSTYQGTRQIAGQTAQCYGIKSKAGGPAGVDEGLVCYSNQGVPLLTQTKSQGTEFSMEATSYSTSVADADFQIPAPPMDIPQIPGIPGLPGGVPQLPRP